MRNKTITKRRLLISLLVLLHIFILVVVFNIGYGWAERRAFIDSFRAGGQKNIAQYLRFHYSGTADDLLYYKYTSAILGKPAGEAWHHHPKEIDFSDEGREKFESGRPVMPYREIGIEYPPLVLPLIIVPRILSDTFSGYRYWLSILVTILVLSSLYTAWRISVGRPDRPPQDWVRTLAYSALVIYSIGMLMIFRLDILPVFFIMLAIHAVAKGRYNLASIWIGCATMAKIYPAIIMPIIWLEVIRNRGFRKVLPSLITFFLTISVIALPFIILDPKGFISIFTYHSQRGLQIESLYSLGIIFCDLFTHKGFQIINTFGADHLISPAADLVASISPLITIAALLLIYKRHYSCARGCSSHTDLFIVSTLTATATFIITSKVSSPQFIIWFFPVILLIPAYLRILTLTVFFFYALTTQAGYATYSLLPRLEPAAVILLLIRQAFLLALFIIILRTQRRGCGSP